MDSGFYNKYIAFNNSYLTRYLVHDTIRTFGITKNLNKKIDESLKEGKVIYINKNSKNDDSLIEKNEIIKKKVRFSNSRDKATNTTIVFVDKASNTNIVTKKLSISKPIIINAQTKILKKPDNQYIFRSWNDKKIGHGITNRIIMNSKK